MPGKRETPGSRQAGRLARLAANAEAGQWSAARDIDWRCGPRLPAWISSDQARVAISQLYHGELATAGVCRRLLHGLGPGALRRCLEWQIADEDRHALVYDRYLDRLGGVAPVEPILARALAAAAGGPAGKLGMMLAYHVVVEGEVLRLQGLISRFLPCPLLRQINRRIACDEARHVAFGRIYLEDAVAGWPEATRAGTYDWLRRTWDRSIEITQETRGRSSTARRVLRQGLKGGWSRHAAALKRIGLTPMPCPEHQG